MLNRIKSKFLNKHSVISQQQDIIGKLNMSAIKFNSFLPHTGSSLRYSSINYLLNDVIINKRRNIIEFGGGISTIYLSKLAIVNGLKMNIITVENNKNWINVIKDFLDKEELSSTVKIIHSPLINSKKTLNNNLWYNENTIKTHIKGTMFDLVIIDGPMAYTKHEELSRYPALPFIKQYLNKKHAIFLDDTNRKGEQTIIKIWEKELGNKFVKLNTTSHISLSGDSMNIK